MNADDPFGSPPATGDRADRLLADWSRVARSARRPAFAPRPAGGSRPTASLGLVTVLAGIVLLAVVAAPILRSRTAPTQTTAAGVPATAALPGATASGLAETTSPASAPVESAGVAGIRAPALVMPDELADPADPRALGAASAPVTVQVWFDFQCPYCASFEAETLPLFIDRYVRTGVARLVLRDDALIDASATGESHRTAVAARCAADQGRFWSYASFLFANQTGENQGGFSPARLRAIADAAGLDGPPFEACIGGGFPAKLAAVVRETEAASASGINQVPTVVVNGRPQAPAGSTVPGGALSFAELSKAVEAAAEKARGPSLAPTLTPGP
jgi:protein-disulfide isomerase